jgi:hypothetical protein
MADWARTQEIIDQITAGSGDSGHLANELLREFQRGYAVEQLRPLLSSADDGVAEIAAWIASELGARAEPLLDDLVALLGHPVREVRFDAIGAVAASATGPDSYRAARVLPLLDDTEPAVRWKAMRFLSHAPADQLHAALDRLRADEPSHPHVPRLQWLLSPGARDPAAAIAFLSSSDANARRYAAAAAVRLLVKDRTALEHAASSDDPEIKRFATDMLTLNPP